MSSAHYKDGDEELDFYNQTTEQKEARIQNLRQTGKCQRHTSENKMRK